MQRVRYRLAAFKEIRRDPGVVARLERAGRAVKNSAGDGYEISSNQGKTRWRVGVYTRTNRAKRDNAKHNSLIRALDSGRG
jgi:hypothetical protein